MRFLRILGGNSNSPPYCIYITHIALTTYTLSCLREDSIGYGWEGGAMGSAIEMGLQVLILEGFHLSLGLQLNRIPVQTEKYDIVDIFFDCSLGGLNIF
jgi:hypothetical protein